MVVEVDNDMVGNCIQHKLKENQVNCLDDYTSQVEEGEKIMDKVENQIYEGERALFHQENLQVFHSLFQNGESPLKECQNIEVYHSMFKWKYPVWYSKNIKIQDSYWFDMARAGVWYSDQVSVHHSVIEAPKNFRRCKDLTLEDVDFTNAQETLWHCQDVKMNNVTAKGDYFAMNCEDMKIDHLKLVGNYPFDGVKNVEIHNSKLMSKDAFWNAENVVVYDSFISGEYLGWNSKNLTFINCTIESLQGMCYIENLKMINCKLINTTLAFEYSTVEAQIDGKIDSVMNPTSGRIIADSIDELIIEKDRIDPRKTLIICRDQKGV